MLLKSLILFFFMTVTGVSGLFNHEKFILKNGLTVYVLKNDLAPIINVSLCYKVGTADDPRKLHGLSHFLEHMMFKGTTNVPKGEFDRLLLTQGGSYNAFTTDDVTCYTTDAAKDQLELILFLEADRMANLSFSEQDIRSEREVVIEERAMRMDNNPFGRAIEAYLRALYWEHPYGIPAIGYLKHINAYTFDAVRKHYRAYYAPNNAILIVAGDTDVGTVKKLCEKYFGPLSPSHIPKRERAQEEEHGDITTILEYYADRNKMVHIQYAYKAPNFSGEHKKYCVPLLIAGQVLAGNALSRLYKKFVEGEQLAASVSADYDYASIDPRTFDISVTLNDAINPTKVRALLEEEIELLRKDGITKEELKGAKRDILAKYSFMKDGLASTVEAFSDVSMGISEDELENWDKIVQAVTKEEVMEAVRFLFQRRPEVILTLYPKDYKQSAQNHEVSNHATRTRWDDLRSMFKDLMSYLFSFFKKPVVEQKN